MVECWQVPRNNCVCRFVVWEVHVAVFGNVQIDHECDILNSVGKWVQLWFD